MTASNLNKSNQVVDAGANLINRFDEGAVCRYRCILRETHNEFSMISFLLIIIRLICLEILR